MDDSETGNNSDQDEETIYESIDFDSNDFDMNGMSGNVDISSREPSVFFNLSCEMMAGSPAIHDLFSQDSRGKLWNIEEKVSVNCETRTDL